MEVFEPAGNFLYGFIGTLGGIAPYELHGAARVTQEGRPLVERPFTPDSAEDRPHVDYGIQMATAAMRYPQSILKIDRD